MVSPVLPESRLMTGTGVQLHYVDWGGEGAPVLLIHGLGSTLHIWDLVAPLLTAGRRVVALDLRGHGLSEKPDHGYDFATIAADVVAFVHALGLHTPLSVVGHSWGGYVALYLAVQHPALARDVALVDGGVVALHSWWPTWEVAKPKLTPPPLGGKPVAEMRRLIQTDWLGEAWTPQLGELAMHCYAVDATGHIWPRLALSNHMQIAEAIWEFTPASFFAHVTCPALLVVPLPPQASPLTDTWLADKLAQVAAAEQQLRHGRIAWLPDTIHDVPWQRPEALAALLQEFWATAHG